MKTLHRSLKKSIALHHRQGTVLYSTVLGTTLIVSLLSLAGLNVVRIERQQARVSTDRRDARDNARSAVELALKVMDLDPNWRSKFANGVETSPMPLGSNATGTLSWIFEDIDGSLTDADTELWLKGVGRVGSTTQVSSLRLAEIPQPLTSLKCSVYAVGDLEQTADATTSRRSARQCRHIEVNGNVIGDVEGNPVQLGGSVSGTITDPGPERVMPLPTVWDTYLPLATSIPYANFTFVNATTRTMQSQLLGATVNPFGSLNAQGVYHIQIPAGQTLTVQQSRIHGTLLIELETGATFVLDIPNLWDPYVGTNYPAMLVKGPATGSANVTLQSSTSRLNENTINVNLNPSNEPYNGITDSDQSDRYDPICRGLFHVTSANVHTLLGVDLNLQGVFISEGTVSLYQMDATVDTNLFANPPPGYVGPTMISPVSGSWILGHCALMRCEVQSEGRVSLIL